MRITPRMARNDIEGYSITLHRHTSSVESFMCMAAEHETRSAASCMYTSAVLFPAGSFIPCRGRIPGRNFIRWELYPLSGTYPRQELYPLGALPPVGDDEVVVAGELVQ